MSEEHVQTEAYCEPVRALLILGEAPARTHPWPDYLRYGFDASHTAELTRMATDPELDEAAYPAAEFWSPIHAWRALGQLGAAEAVEPLLELMDERAWGDDDWATEELPEVFAMIGPTAVKPVEAFLDDRGRNMRARAAAAHALVEIAGGHADLRDKCVAMLARQLHSYAYNDEMFNGLIVAHLLNLEAVEAAELIEQAFAAGYVDELCAGDWPEVRYELGLGPKPEPRRAGLLERFFGGGADLPFTPTPPPPVLQGTHVRQPRTRKKRRSKRKQARKARSHNRK